MRVRIAQFYAAVDQRTSALQARAARPVSTKALPPEEPSNDGA